MEALGTEILNVVSFSTAYHASTNKRVGQPLSLWAVLRACAHLKGTSDYTKLSSVQMSASVASLEPWQNDDSVLPKKLAGMSFLFLMWYVF